MTTVLTRRDDGGGCVVCGHREVDDRLSVAVDVDAGGADVGLLPLERAHASRPGSVAQGEPAAALGGKGADGQIVDLGNLKELVLKEKCQNLSIFHMFSLGFIDHDLVCSRRRLDRDGSACGQSKFKSIRSGVKPSCHPI